MRNYTYFLFAITITIITFTASKGNKMKTLIKPKQMSDAAFKSMVERNNMTVKNVQALRDSLERGKVK